MHEIYSDKLECVEALINQIEEEKKNKKKW